MQYTDKDTENVQRLVKEIGAAHTGEITSLYNAQRRLLERERVEDTAYRLARAAYSELGERARLFYQLGDALFPDFVARSTPTSIAELTFHISPDDLRTAIEATERFLAANPGGRVEKILGSRPTPTEGNGDARVEYRGRLIEYILDNTGILLTRLPDGLYEEIADRLGL